MNTLKFKALFKIGFFIFLRSLGLYLLLTTPALLLFPMYVMSAAYALSFGWIAAIIFLPLFIIILQTQQSEKSKKTILYIIVLPAVLIAFQMMEVTGVQDHIWREPVFLLFPLAAVLAGWISLLVANKRIEHLLQPVEAYEEGSIFSGIQ